MLCQRDERFCVIVNAHGLPSLRASPQGLEGLLMIITEQFLSLSAAAAIWRRVKAELGACTPADVLGCSEENYLKLGLSRAKVRAFRGAAELDFNFENVDEQAIAKLLCKVSGVGPWTADIYLLSVLGAANAWPKGDLALRVAAQDFLSLAHCPQISEMEGLAKDWQPWRAVAARLLWSHYRGLKKLPQAIE